MSFAHPEPQKCFDHVYCSAFADQCSTESDRIRQMCPITCGRCTPDGNLIIDDDFVSKEVLELVHATDDMVCGIDNFVTCSTWIDHCDQDYIRIQCSATCNYCPEVLPSTEDEKFSDLIPEGSGEWGSGEWGSGDMTIDLVDDGCRDIDPNCEDYEKENHCDMETIQILCPTTCEVGPCGIAPGNDLIEIGSGDFGSGDFGSGEIDIPADIPDHIPMSCRSGGEYVDVGQGQGQIEFVAPADLPYEHKMCQYHIRNPDDEEIVLLNFYGVFDIRTEQNCLFYVEVYSGETPLVRLCGNGKHPPVAGRDLTIRVEAYSGFGFAVEMSSISQEGFNIIQTVSEEKYLTVDRTHVLRASCVDEPYCVALRNACHDDLVSDRCPVTCGKCHAFEKVTILDNINNSTALM